MLATERSAVHKASATAAAARRDPVAAPAGSPRALARMLAGADGASRARLARALQHTHGNASVQRLATLSRCGCGGSHAEEECEDCRGKP
jgi:hypothetical protein